MASELTVAMTANYSRSGVTKNDTYSKVVDVSGDPLVEAVQEVGTTEENLALGDVTAPGYVQIKNLDSTNYCEFGKSTTVYTVKLKAGEVALFRLSGTAIFAKANTAATKIWYRIWTD